MSDYNKLVELLNAPKKKGKSTSINTYGDGKYALDKNTKQLKFYVSKNNAYLNMYKQIESYTIAYAGFNLKFQLKYDGSNISVIDDIEYKIEKINNTKYELKIFKLRIFIKIKNDLIEHFKTSQDPYMTNIEITSSMTNDLTKLFINGLENYKANLVDKNWNNYNGLEEKNTRFDFDYKYKYISSIIPKEYMPGKDIITNDFIEQQDIYGFRAANKNLLMMLNYFEVVKDMMNNPDLHKYYWIGSENKCYTIKPKASKETKIVEVLTDEKVFKERLEKIITPEIYKILRRYPNLYITGSVIPAIINNTNYYNDIDVVYTSTKGNITSYMFKILKDLVEKGNFISFDMVSKYKCKIKIPAKKLNFEIFIIDGSLAKFTSRFHLPIVRAIFALDNQTLYCHQSFIRAVTNRICWIRSDRFYSLATNTRVGIIYKWFTRDYIFKMNEKEKNIFIEYLKQKNTEYELE